MNRPPDPNQTKPDPPFSAHDSMDERIRQWRASEAREPEVPGPPPTWQLVVLCVVSSAIVAAPFVAMSVWELWEHAPKILIGFLLYVGLGSVFKPKMETNNMGWMGGLTDDPTTFDDDHNRFFATIALLLLPGQIVAVTLVSLWRTVQARR